MEKITGNEPAMPLIEEDENKVQRSISPGLTIRQHFAGLAMQGLLSHEGWTERMVLEKSNAGFIQQIAEASVKMSDTIISELNKPKP